MDNIITALFRYAENSNVDSGPFTYKGVYLEWEQAITIVQKLNDYDYTMIQLNEKIEMLEDYNRLLREENCRLRSSDND